MREESCRIGAEIFAKIPAFVAADEFLCLTLVFFLPYNFCRVSIHHGATSGKYDPHIPYNPKTFPSEFGKRISTGKTF